MVLAHNILKHVDRDEWDGRVEVEVEGAGLHVTVSHVPAPGHSGHTRHTTTFTFTCLHPTCSHLTYSHSDHGSPEPVIIGLIS